MSFSLAERTAVGCQWLLEDYVPCGLLANHDGEHVPFAPGDYLPPPLLHPLDMWLLLPAWRCPVCTEKFNCSPGAEVVTVFRGDWDNWIRAVPEWQWEFQPCGCVGRAVPDGYDEALAGEARA